MDERKTMTRQPTMDRRTFVRWALGGVVLGGGTSALAGCSGRLADTVSLDDNREKPARDYEETSDEPKVSTRLLASDEFALALEPLQEAYRQIHPNVVFEEPLFVPAVDIPAHYDDPSFSGFLTGLDGVIESAVAAGAATEHRCAELLTAHLVFVCSEDIAERVDREIGVGFLAEEWVRQVLVGDPADVFSGKAANQTLYYDDFYSAGIGVGGAYTGALVNKIKTPSSFEEIVDLTKSEAGVVGLLLSSETDICGASTHGRIVKERYDPVFYRGAALEGHASMANAFDFFEFCATDTEAMRVASAYGFNDK